MRFPWVKNTWTNKTVCDFIKCFFPQFCCFIPSISHIKPYSDQTRHSDGNASPSFYLNVDGVFGFHRYRQQRAPEKRRHRNTTWHHIVRANRINRWSDWKTSHARHLNQGRTCCVSSGLVLQFKTWNVLKPVLLFLANELISKWDNHWGKPWM